MAEHKNGSKELGRETLRNPEGKQALWEKKWSSTDYCPPWITDEPPEELRRTVLKRGFLHRGRVLDIGCGDGAIAAWLARQDYSVLGIDFSEAAIKKASLRFSDIPQLEFRSMDVCGKHADIGKFDVLFDRGCLHTISPRLAERYVANIADWAKQGAIFLLIHKTPVRDNEPVAAMQQKVRAYLGKLFKPWFDLKAIRPTVIRGGTRDSHDFEMPCLAVWMVRK